jgi:hypothetical protein
MPITQSVLSTDKEFMAQLATYSWTDGPILRCKRARREFSSLWQRAENDGRGEDEHKYSRLLPFASHFISSNSASRSQYLEVLLLTYLFSF